jgi:hydrogenase expression/formation protein HypC
MCLGVPGRIVEAPATDDELRMGLVEFAGVRRSVCLACVPEAGPGDYVVVHAGFAISRLDVAEAARVFDYLQEIGDLEGWTDEIRR